MKITYTKEMSLIQVVGILSETITKEKCNNFIMFYVQLITIKLTDSSPKRTRELFLGFIWFPFSFRFLS